MKLTGFKPIMKNSIIFLLETRGELLVSQVRLRSLISLYPVCQTYKLTPQATWLQVCFWHKLPCENSESQIYHPQLRLEAIEGINSTSDLGEKNLTVEMKVRESPLDLEKLDRNTENQELYYSLTKTKQNHQTTLSTYLQQTFSKLMKIQTLHWITSLCCSVDKSCLTLGNPRYFSTPGFPVHHYLHITLEYWL